MNQKQNQSKPDEVENIRESRKRHSRKKSSRNKMRVRQLDLPSAVEESLAPPDKETIE